MNADTERQPHPAEIFFGNLIATFFVSVFGLLIAIWLLKVLQVNGGGTLLWWALGMAGTVKFISLFRRLWPTMNVALCTLLSCTLSAINTYLSMGSVFLILVVAFGE